MNKRVTLIVAVAVGLGVVGTMYYRSTHAKPGAALVTATVTRGNVVEDVYSPAAARLSTSSRYDARRKRSTPSRRGSTTRVELLKGGEFLRISARRGSERYLVYLPVAP